MKQSYHLQLRTSLANHVLFGKSIDIDLLRNPLRKAHPLSEMIAHLLTDKRERPLPSFETKNLSLSDLCQLAILKSIAGEDGEFLAQEILPFTSFPSMWSLESAFNAKDTISSISLLLKAFGKETSLPENADPYFFALEKQLPHWKEKTNVSQDNSLGSIQTGSSIQFAFSREGDGISLGAICASGIKIPAFGPHLLPLNDSKFFGMCRSDPDCRWASVSAKKEIWFEVISDIERKMLETRFVGIKPTDSVFFVFYVKADFARIGQEVYLPKSLRRFAGESKSICFEREGNRLTVTQVNPSKMELIPLAGGGCFWDSDFLLGFEIPIHDGRGAFQFGM